ncbi:MAG: hypothetical protein QOH06_634 [Acidobacteriota bacterium]|nr:hypothetical protein [Acidobacteriota bacterium]
MRDMRRTLLFALCLLIPVTGHAAEKKARSLDPDLWKPLEWREVGPYRGGRSAAVTGLPGERDTYYFGSTGGGVWKTTNGGRNWKPVSDGFFGGSIGTVDVSELDPNVVYVGTGESTVRGNVSHGDGMWKSTDAGKTWTHAGLPESRHIPRVRIHPRDPDIVYAAVLGHLFGPNPERGVYRTRNGGKTWERILFVNENAGAIDLILDPTNPRILYASTWRVRRTPYSLESGGPGSALWKSTDGGDTWLELTKNPGMPKGPLGIIGVTVSPTNPENVYAIVEAEEGGVFRSRDGGRTWTKSNDERALRQRAWYYTRIYADPKDEEAVYVVNVQFHRSKDGGKTFTAIRTPHGDNHDLWIDPADPLRMIESNDGGANVSMDGGRTWTGQDNQPTAQFYRVSTDNDFPYRLLGGQQDNSAMRIRSRSAFDGAIGERDWDETAGGESGYVVADPQNPDVIYGGSYGGLLVRLNHDTGEASDVNVWPDDPMGGGAADLKYRFQWNYPILFSPHDPDMLYAAANVLFRSTNEGRTWEAISPDLTRNDKSKQGPSGGPITKDNTSVEYYGTIFTVAESPLEKGVLWTGSDDGLVHVSRDAGKAWKNVTPKGMPEWMMINSVDAHPFEKGGLYVAGTKYKSDDFRPYLYRTTDYGATWTRIDQGIDPMHFTRVVRADPVRRGLLYAGTEHGVYVSFDDGGRWQPLQLNLPIVPITDLAIKNDELIAATQGRGFWILNGLANLRQLPGDLAPKSPHLFEPAPVLRVMAGGFQAQNAAARNQGTNPPAGAVVYYFLDKAPSESVAKEAKLEFLDGDGKVIRSFSGMPAGTKPAEKAEARTEGEEEEQTTEETETVPGKETEKKKPKKDEEEQKAPMEAGLNRFAWDLRYGAGKVFPGLILWSGDPFVPMILPGSYQVRLTVGDVTRTAPLQVAKDPRTSATQEDLEAQHRFLMDVRAKIDETHDAIRQVRDVRAQLDDLKQRIEDQEAEEKHAKVLDAAKALGEKMTKAEEALYQTKNRSPQDPLNFPVRLNDKLNALANSVGGFGDARPTDQAVQVKEELTRAIDAELARLSEIFAKDLPALNELARTEGISTVILSPSRLK